MLKPLKEAMAQWNPDPDSEWPEWADNIISVRALAYSPCGMMTRQGTSIEHKHAANELAMCQRLSSQAAKIMKGIPVTMSDEGDNEFVPFYICGTVGAKVPEKITEKYLRSAFGGIIHPRIDITIYAMKARGEWWDRFTSQDRTDHYEKGLRARKALVDWFHASKDLHSPTFVSMGLKGYAEPGFGSMFPQLSLAITKKGSLVGLCVCLAWT
jgi:hypothetical protein